MSDREPPSGSSEVGDVQADDGAVAAGRDIHGGVHTGPEFHITIDASDLQDRDQVLGKVQELKELYQSGGSGAVQSVSPASSAMPMQPFQAQMPDPYQGGAQWLPQLQQVAAQQGSSWVPTQTQGVAGIDLTGVWVPPGNPMEVDYVRQAGPYLNMIIGAGGVQTGYSEGLFDPASGMVRLAGLYANGVPLEAQLQLFPNWTLQGWVSGLGPYGPMTTPVFLMKAA